MQTVLAVLCLVPAAALVRGAPSRVAATPRKASPSAYLSEIPRVRRTPSSASPRPSARGRRLLDRGEKKEYAPIEGLADFRQKALEFAYGEDCAALKEGRIAGVQALSGARRVRVAGEFWRFLPEGTAVYVSDPTWGNHIPIMELAGLEVRKYRYLDRETNGLDYGVPEDIDAAPAEAWRRIGGMRVRLREEIEAAGSEHDWTHVTDQIGMFAFTGMTSDMCDTLTADYSIYLTKDGRISVAGVNSGNIKYIAKAVREVTHGKEIGVAA
ncbi:aspartate aminotransferase [Aureococcus anophagefferens]|nr:aspartate aminotransferase [Aureococcus anophagefferens]